MLYPPEVVNTPFAKPVAKGHELKYRNFTTPEPPGAPITEAIYILLINDGAPL